MLFWIPVLILKFFISGLCLPKTGICPVVLPLRTVHSSKCASSSLLPSCPGQTIFLGNKDLPFHLGRVGIPNWPPEGQCGHQGYLVWLICMCLSVSLHMRSVWSEKFSNRRTQAPYAELTIMKPLHVWPAWLIFWKHLLLSLGFYTAYETHNNWTYTSSRET